MAILADRVQFKGYSCFRSNWAGFSSLKQVNVVIGKNNTGKSQLLDLIALMCQPTLRSTEGELECSGLLDTSELQRHFHQSTSQGQLGGNHWEHHGQHMIGRRVRWEINSAGNPINVMLEGDPVPNHWGEASNQARVARLSDIVRDARHTFANRTFSRLLADRDIQAEEARNELRLAPSGQGATNIIRRYLTSSVPKYPRAVVQEELLHALNTVFGDDAHFTEIYIKHHDESSDLQLSGKWEVYVGEHHKGLIQLSRSGSGLKTVILVLLNLLVLPRILERDKSSFIFAFEELENNLHPSLLRRLLRFVEEYAIKEKAPVFLTTHSSAALDLFGLSDHATITHVSHDGQSARCSPVTAHFDRVGVVAELGARPSDLLQANGIIWVEGPSDRLYLTKWIETASEGQLREGRDYQCAFYGGALLGRVQFTETGDLTELANLLCINPNIIVVCDSDKSTPDDPLKARVSRIQSEVARVPSGHIWVTEAREIENYLTGAAISNATEATKTLRDPGQFESFFPRVSEGKGSYLEKNLGKLSIDKVELALRCMDHIDRQSMAGRFDLEGSISEIVQRIRQWNR